MTVKRIENTSWLFEVRYRRLFETAQDGILLLDAETGQITDVNPFLADMLGYDADDILSMKLWELGPFKGAETIEHSFNELHEEAYIRHEDLTLVTKDGRNIEVEVVSNVYSINDEKVIQYNIHDITERRIHERERSDFLTMVTHDFKSPLAIIMGYADLIASDESLDRRVLEMAAYIHKGGEKLLGMVDDFLFHVKLESGTLIPKLAPLDVYEIIKEVESEFALLAAKKRQVIEVKFAENLPILFLDKYLIERALSNLVQNAVNYTPDGGRISIKAERRSGEEADFASISVTDTGRGIPAEHKHKLFDRYFRSNDARSVKGAGLGLTIVKAVAEAHKGRVELQSELGKGSTFSLILPARLSPETW